QRKKLSDLLIKGNRLHMGSLVNKLELVLHQQGFTQVTTPTIITKAALAKMTIDDEHPLFKQIYWINEKLCLRPMLATNLYSLMVDLSRLNHCPIRFFEIGSCFRKESDGARHSSEFTMLNLVEMGLSKKNRDTRLKELAAIITKAAGLDTYKFDIEDSTVYGTTLDVVAGRQNIEVASGAMGPHPLDAAWGITDTWVGIGFGLERLLMISRGDTSIGKWQKSLSYLNGIRLNI
ncbi:MAG: pyrrolysine--tRNA(Pyl) ligase large subunit, partial [Desulfobacula sp.]|nr:pyrrolysine--tRNA(Pyl) ligase large subunit [Desulfobacula sp.]